MYKTHKLQEHIVQHRDYSQYFYNCKWNITLKYCESLFYIPVTF